MRFGSSDDSKSRAGGLAAGGFRTDATGFLIDVVLEICCKEASSWDTVGFGFICEIQMYCLFLSKKIGSSD
jgi:hypothetical protein